MSNLQRKSFYNQLKTLSSPKFLQKSFPYFNVVHFMPLLRGTKYYGQKMQNQRSEDE